MQCLRKPQLGQGVFPLLPSLPPILHYSSTEQHPVREKHKTVALKGSNGYSLVHSEVKTHLGNTNSKRREEKFAIPLGVSLAIWLSVLMSC